MPYVQRDGDGQISAIMREPQPGAHPEFLPGSHPEVLAFLSISPNDENVRLALMDSDAELARVTEDLIHLLVEKNLILFTELPNAVQEKLMAREQLRAQLRPGASSILSEDESI